MKHIYMYMACASLYVTVATVGCGDDETTPGGTGTVTTTTGDGGNGGSGGDGGSGGTAPDPYVFQDYPDTAYARVDRHGAVEAGTVGFKIVAGLCEMGLTPGFGAAVDCAIRDDYNADDPADDVSGGGSGNGKWVDYADDGIAASVGTLQTALADDLATLTLTAADLATGLAQAGPVIVPDAIKYNPADAVGYPNGRALTDPVVDITVAAAILDLTVQGQDLDTLVGTNPTANDVAFKTSFPYLADPH